MPPRGATLGGKTVGSKEYAQSGKTIRTKKPKKVKSPSQIVDELERKGSSYVPPRQAAAIAPALKKDIETRLPGKRVVYENNRLKIHYPIPTLTSAKTPRPPRLTRDQELEMSVDALIAREPSFERSARKTNLSPFARNWVLGESLADPGFDPSDPYEWLDTGLGLTSVLPPSWALTKGARAGVRGGAAFLKGGGKEGAKNAARQTYEAPGLTRQAARKMRSLTVGTKTQQLDGEARSRVTRTLIERPADAVSRAMMGEGKIASVARKVPGLKTASAEQRVAKAAGREQMREAERAAARMKKYERVLPKEGSAADVAHFWWAQLPKNKRNVEGLKLIRTRQAEELSEITSGRALGAIQASIAAVKTKLKGADEGTRFGLLSDLEELKVLATDLPNRADDIARSMAELDKVIAKRPVLDAKVIAAVRAFSEDRERVLGEAGLLKPERAAERRGLVSRWADVPASGDEAYVGHRLGKVRSSPLSLLPVSPGTGRARLPQGVSQENKLVLAKTGRVRPSTHVAAEDWRASQTYQAAVTARDDLAAMGKPYSGRLPEDHVLVNPKGRAVPAHMKDDRAKKLADGDEEEVLKVATEILDGFIADDTNYKAMLEAAEAAGVQWDELRVVSKEVLERYYGQFTPAKGTTRGGKIYDVAVDFTAASIVFARIGYIPKGIAGNLIMAVPHQGAFFLVNAPRAAQVLAKPELRDLIASEIGGGATSSLAREARYSDKARGVPGKLARGVSWVADEPLRISAFIHEAAAEGVIPKFKPVLDAEDEAALFDFLLKDENRSLLNKVRARAVEAMADFSRLTPTQRRWSRRFLIVPGWLYAGSRYPFHFAATHPGRSAAIAYAATGMPGADQLGLPQTPSITDLEEEDLPHFAQGLDTPWGTLRTGPISPVSTFWEIANAARQSGARTLGDYLNPLIPSVYNTAGRRKTYPGGSYQTNFLDSLESNAKRLAPNVGLVEDLISPSGEGAYPGDATRLGRLKRELGVLPIEVRPEEKKSLEDRNAATQASMKEAITKNLPPKYRQIAARDLEAAFARKTEVDELRSKIQKDTDSGDPYYREVFPAELDLAVKWKLIKPQIAKERKAWAARASATELEEEVRYFRESILTDHLNTINEIEGALEHYGWKPSSP